MNKMSKKIMGVATMIAFIFCGWANEINHTVSIMDGVEEDYIFIVVEVPPSFPGGSSEMNKFISQNMRYPKTALENGIQGTVYVSFVVQKDGKITGIQVMRSAGEILDEEAIRVIKSMPPWIPGVQKGEPVATRFILPLRFVLQDSNNNPKDNSKKK